MIESRSGYRVWVVLGMDEDFCDAASVWRRGLCIIVVHSQEDVNVRGRITEIEEIGHYC